MPLEMNIIITCIVVAFLILSLVSGFMSLWRNEGGGPPELPKKFPIYITGSIVAWIIATLIACWWFGEIK